MVAQNALHVRVKEFFCWKYAPVDVKQTPLTDQITSFTQHLRMVYWATILYKYHGSSRQYVHLSEV